ncbi:MAG: twin-arginine translocation pathway signal protein [Candidatus Methanoperedenaceae archaeon]|nr:MAG: twin-arginine translocation pathway signal protein [Candidatus Methanoperedenaceae archaeon]
MNFKKLYERPLVFGFAILIIAAGVVSLSYSPKEIEEKPMLKIGYLPITHSMLPVVAHAQGKFSKVNVEMVKFSSWTELAEALKAGKIDGGGSILNTLAIKLAEQGVPLRSVLMAVRDGSVLVVKNDIKDVKELKNKTIAIPSKFSPHYILLQKYLEDNGLDVGNDVKTIELAPPDMVSALASGSIDGYIVAEPFGAKAEDSKIGRVLVLSKDIEIPGSTSNECVIAIRSEFIEKYPEAVQDFVDQLILAGIYVHKSPEEAAKLTVPYYGQKPEIIVRAINDPPGRTVYLDLLPRESEYEAFQNYMLKLGLVKKSIDMKEFVDDRFAKKAYETIGR